MKKILILIFAVSMIKANAQDKYINEISGIENQWHILEFDNKILSKVQNDFSDIRIISVSETDTIEVPYFFKLNKIIENKKGINFNVINKSNIEDKHYFTLKLQDLYEINEIQLKFEQENFNWLVELQASQNQKEWFSILEDYRILSIKNSETNYSFTNLKFPKADYKYYRVAIKSIDSPKLKYASLKSIVKEETHLKDVSNTFKLTEERKRTVIEVLFEDRISVSELKLMFSDEIDFQRPITIEYLVDSFQTEKAWIYNYQHITNSYVSSLEKNVFNFSAVFTNRIRLSINNYDNESLNVKTIETKFPNYRIVARFLYPENKHYLVYGDTEKQIPNYDIVNFKQNVPSQLEYLDLGNQVSLIKEEVNSSLTNKWWLWAIIILIVAMLGYSTLSMLKKDVQ